MPRFVRRYARLYLSEFLYCLSREIAFRANFAARLLAEVGWMAMIICFFEIIFGHTDSIGPWSRLDYFFFMGVGFFVNGLANALFMENCSQFQELVRTGDLDFVLTQPVDEQFLLTTRRIDFAELFTAVAGVGLMTYSLAATGRIPTPIDLLFMGVLFAAALAILYSLICLVASTAIYTIRNRGLVEVWWYASQFARYPADIYLGKGSLLGMLLYGALMFVLPLLLAINTPARYGAGLTEGLEFFAGYLIVSAIVLFWVSRRIFRHALASYRSASS